MARAHQLKGLLGGKYWGSIKRARARCRVPRISRTGHLLLAVISARDKVFVPAISPYPHWSLNPLDIHNSTSQHPWNMAPPHSHHAVAEGCSEEKYNVNRAAPGVSSCYLFLLRIVCLDFTPWSRYPTIPLPRSLLRALRLE